MLPPTITYHTPIKTLHHQPSYNGKLFNSDSIHREGDWVCLNCQNLNYSFRKKCNRCKTQSRQDNEAHSVYSYYYYPNNNNTNNNMKMEEPLKFTTDNKTDHHTGDKSSIVSYNNLSINKQTVVQQFSINDNNDNDNNDYQMNKQNIPTIIIINTTTINEFIHIDNILQTPKKKKHSDKQLSQSNQDNLPSVSPLIKKFKLNTTTEKQHNNNLSTILGLNQTPTKNNNYQLPDVTVRDFDDLINDFDCSPPSINKQDQENEDDCFNFMKDIEDSIAKIII